MTAKATSSSPADSPGGFGLIADATTLPAEIYTSPPVFQREQERIFSKLWLCGGRDEVRSLFQAIEVSAHNFDRWYLDLMAEGDRQ